MASKSYEGNYKAWLLDTEPSAWTDSEEDPEVTEAELDAGTRLERLISDGGVTYTYNQATASQAKLDEGKVSHNLGTREVTGLEITHEADFPLSSDDMWGEYAYGDQKWLVVSPDDEPDTSGDVLHVFQIETGDKQPNAPARDTIQNFNIGCAVQDWNFDVGFEPTA